VCSECFQRRLAVGYLRWELGDGAACADHARCGFAWGAHHADQCAHIANAAAHRYSQEGELPDSLDELRTCLFFEQRRWHHFGATPDGEAQRYFAALLQAIRAKAHAAGES